MRIAFILLLFASGILNAQEFYILNEVDKSSVPNAHIDYLNGAGTTSDSKGKFILMGTIDSIKITSLGFKPLTIKLSNIYPQNKILLQENTIALDEVSLTNKKTFLLKHPKPKKTSIVGRDFTYNETVVTYIAYPNVESNNVIIKNIVINTRGWGSKKRRYYPFKVNLYKLNKEYHPPKLSDSLITGIITARKEGNPSLVKVDVQEYNIPLPLEGIYVSFETLDEQFYPKNILYKLSKKTSGIPVTNYNRYGAVVEIIYTEGVKFSSYSYSLIRKSYTELNGEKVEEKKWQFERDFIFDITLEVEY